ncbi:MAG: endonuclease III domain-containing protein, partial [Dehalococcoidia bacterium]|nr:endonuclease III domain-containing protein [Dehalococcoidia bacterium]
MNKENPDEYRLKLIFDSLLAHYGRQNWWPADNPFEMMIGAILTQSTNWKNVEKALSNLKQAGAMDCFTLAELRQADIAALIRPAGYFNVKAAKLKVFCIWLKENYGCNLNNLFALDTATVRRELLAVFGIGPETADSIILYAAGKPSFVVDAYTMRIFQRLKTGPKKANYGEFREFFMYNLPLDAYLFNEFHALVVKLGKDVCRKIPTCTRCCLGSLCPTADLMSE